MNSTLGQRIKLARGKQSQGAFAQAIQISKGDLGFYERDINLPNSEVVLKICSVSGVNIEWLLTGLGPIRKGEVRVGPYEPAAAPAAWAQEDFRCARLEEKLDRVERQRDELMDENRRLYARKDSLMEEIAALRERVARLEARIGRMELSGGCEPLPDPLA